jgi:hypothetical protein
MLGQLDDFLHPTGMEPILAGHPAAEVDRLPVIG